MGNANSSTEEPLAIIAMAREFGLERRHIVVLRDSLRSHANADFMVSKEYFDHALKDAKVSDPKQIQLFDLLFTMWDYKGNNMIHYKDFCIAVSPLACPYDDIDSIINFTLLIGCETMDGKTEVGLFARPPQSQQLPRSKTRSRAPRPEQQLFFGVQFLYKVSIVHL